MMCDFRAFADRIGLKRRLLVLVPHPDDETLGCGGLLALASSVGVDVTVVLVTDGGASHPGSALWPRPRLVAQRRGELDCALETLGVRRAPVTLGLPDAETERLAPDVVLEAVATIAAVIRSSRPDVVLTTWRREPHSDHRFAFRLARAALALLSHAPPLVEYMVWTPVTGAEEHQPGAHESHSLLLDIAAARETKLSALACHHSQLGELISDDPEGFRLTPWHIETMVGRYERYEQAR